MLGILFIACHQGLGDHLLCNGLYRSLASESLCILPVKKKYFKDVNKMLMDQDNIKIVSYPDSLTDYVISSYINYLPKNLFSIVKLGNYDKAFFKNNMRFDENFYFQAHIDFKRRWEMFKYNRDTIIEKELYDSYGVIKGNYIFLHEDRSRGYEINRKFINKKLKVIEPLPIPSKYTIFDYLMLIENAAEIHCIESSFTVFIESLINIKATKYAHRYARPEANSNWRSEFTYKSDWNIVNLNQA